MIKPVSCLVFLIFLLGAGGQPAIAQQTGVEKEIATLTGEIVKLNRSLDDVARSLRDLLHDQKIQVVIRRIELEERRQAPLGSELRSARSTVRSQQEQLAQMESILENIRQEVDDAVRDGTDPQTVPQRAQLREFETMIELEQDRLQAARTRVIDLENDVARGRDRIEILDEQLQELLDASD